MRSGFGGANIDKILQDEEERYSYPPLEGKVVETVANATDDQTAGAKNIDISIKEVDKWTKILTISDDGRGFKNFDHVIEYCKVGSISKVKTIGDIGFAGVGSLVYIRRAKMEFLETKNINGFHTRIKWFWLPEQRDTKYEEMLTTNDITTPSGTMIHVVITDEEDLCTSTEEYFKDILRRHFNTILLGLHGELKITVNKKPVEPFLPKEVAHRERNFIINGVNCKTYFFQTETELPEEWATLHVVVGKKIVYRIDDFFRQYPIEELKNRVYGYIIADPLVLIITPAKDNFKKRMQPKLWKDFELKSTKEWMDFLKQIDGLANKKSVDEKAWKYIDRLKKIMTDNPEWKMIKDMLLKFTDHEPVRRKCPQCGTEIHHEWKNNSDFYECENNHVFKKKYTWTPTGHTTVIPPTVKVPKSPFETGDAFAPDVYKESWFAVPNIIVINKAMQTYKEAHGKAGDYHYRRCFASAIIENLVKESFIDSVEKDKKFFELFKILGD